MNPLLEVKELEVAFKRGKQKITRIDKVDLQVKEGEILCVVGESGSGKSVTSLSIMGLLGKNGEVTSGSILFSGEELLKMTEKELDVIRGNELNMIFQDAMTSLNPVLTIGNQMVETMQVHQKLSKNEARERAKQMLSKVGLSNVDSLLKKYPHTLSGGMRQRVMIAMALSCNPRLLIADEPTTALDVTIQAQIMKLLKELRSELNMSIILITHDMGLVAEMADRVAVMYAGQIVEEAQVIALFQNPLHPYTRALLQSIPSIRDDKGRELLSIPGVVPEEYHTIEGCRFANRCPFAQNECKERQVFREVQAGHFVRCWKEDIRNARASD